MEAVDRSEQDTTPQMERAAAAATLRVAPLDAEAAERLSREVRKHESAARERGSLSVSFEPDPVAGGAAVKATGALPAVLALLEAKERGGARLFAEATPSTLELSLDGVSTQKAVAINDHLVTAAKNHPAGDDPLDFVTDHAAADARLTVRLEGSVFATAYLAFLVHLHMTQSRL